MTDTIDYDLTREYTKRLNEHSSKPGTPDRAELIQALRATLVCIAHNPDFWAEEAMVRGLLWRCRPKKPDR